jgi:hypothetical protein
MNAIEPTWEPYEEQGRLTTRSDLPETVFAFPRQRKEPLTDAQHVRNAVAGPPSLWQSSRRALGARPSGSTTC